MRKFLSQKKNWWVLGVVVILTLLLGRCLRSEKQPTVKEEQTRPESAVATAPVRTPLEVKEAEITILPQVPTVNDDLRLVVAGGGQIVSTRWQKDGVEIADATGTNLSKGNFAKGVVISVAVTGEGFTGESSVQIRNSPPRITAVKFFPATFYHGTDLTAAPVAEDSDADTLRFIYLWSVNGEELSASDSPVLPGDRFRRGVRIALRVSPFDDEEEGAAFQSGEIIVPNAPPIISTAPPASFKSQVYRYQVRAEDTDGDSLTYNLVNPPDGMTINKGTGDIIWPIGEGQYGKHIVRIEIEDEAGAKALQEYAIILSPLEQVKN
jgi:hypothetical protein